MVRRVARRRERLPAEHVAVGDADVLLGHRRELAPERVEQVAVEAPRRALEPRRVDEVRRADLARPRRSDPGGGARAGRRRPRGRGGCARAAGGGRRRARGRARRARPRAPAASTSGRSRRARGRRRCRRGRRRSRVRAPPKWRSISCNESITQSSQSGRTVRAHAVADPRRSRPLVLVAAAQRQLTPEPSLAATRAIGYPLPRARRPVCAPRGCSSRVGYHGAARCRSSSRRTAAASTSAANALIWGDLPGEGGFARHQPGRRGTAAALVLVGRRGPDRRPGAHARDRRGARGPTSTGAGSTRSAARWAARRRCCSSRSTRTCSPARPRSIRRPTCAAATATSPRCKTARTLQALARDEIGGTPAQVPAAYARAQPRPLRGGDRAAPASRCSSTGASRDRVIADQRSRRGALARAILRATTTTRASGTSTGEWEHTAEMRSSRRLPRALARFGLLPWRDVPPLPCRLGARRRWPPDERRVEVGEQVVGRLDPDRQAHEVRRAARTARRRSTRASCAPGARSGSRRRRATRRAGRASSARRARPLPARVSARNETIPPKSRICARATSWPGGSAGPGRARARRASWPVEELGDRARVLAVLAHADGERLDPAQHEPRVERAGHRAERLLQEVEALGERVVVRRDEAADGVAVAAEVLRRRVDDGVGAEVERLLQVRRRERVVDDEQRADRVRRVCGLADVDDVQQRVRRRLDPHHASRRRRGATRGCRRTRSPGRT